MTGIRVHQAEPLQTIDFCTQLVDERRERIALSPVPAICRCVLRDQNDFLDSVRYKIARLGKNVFGWLGTMRAFDCRDDAKCARAIAAVGDFKVRAGTPRRARQLLDDR